jgi:hypothetical protein
MICKIISGGQTGVDRAALKFAIDNGIEHGGFCPKGRRCEGNRKIPDRFKLTETTSSGYTQRTTKNVLHSDGTLIISRGHPTGGSLRTVVTCDGCGKPRFVVDAKHPLRFDEFVGWVREFSIEVLNVAGPRESKQSGIEKEAYEVLTKLFARLRQEKLAQ